MKQEKNMVDLCINFLSCATNTTNSVAYNNGHLLPHSFCGLEAPSLLSQGFCSGPHRATMTFGWAICSQRGSCGENLQSWLLKLLTGFASLWLQDRGSWLLAEGHPQLPQAIIPSCPHGCLLQDILHKVILSLPLSITFGVNSNMWRYYSLLITLSPNA